MAGAAVVGACAALLARFVLLPERPDSAWRSGVRALRARVHTLLHAVDALGAEPGSAVRRRRVHDELLRLNATALSLGTTFAALDELPPERADELRRHVLDVELAAGALVTAVDGLVDGPVDAAARPAVAQVTAALDHDVAEAARASRDDRGPARRRRFPRGRHGGAPAGRGGRGPRHGHPHDAARHGPAGRARTGRPTGARRRTR